MRHDDEHVRKVGEVRIDQGAGRRGWLIDQAKCILNAVSPIDTTLEHNSGGEGLVERPSVRGRGTCAAAIAKRQEAHGATVLDGVIAVEGDHQRHVGEGKQLEGGR